MSPPARAARASLRLWLPLLLTLAFAAGAVAQPSIESITATEQFEYSYHSESRREILENWLDVSYLFGSFRTGILLNAQQPSEEGLRKNGIRHRFVEFSLADASVRAGHFYGLYGRGLVFATYEDRGIRVDSALDGAIASIGLGRFRASGFSGTPSEVSRDVRGADLEFDAGRAFTIGATGLTYAAPDPPEGGPRANREWVASGRASKILPFGDVYLEYGRKKGYDYDPVPDDRWQSGHAAYGAVSLLGGPVSLVLEGKDYRRFAVIRKADGHVPLNNPPALTREHVYALLSRNAHNMDPDDEVGAQAEMTITGPAGWSAILNANRTERHEGALLFREAYAALEKQRIGDLRLRGAFGYQEADGFYQTAVGEVTWLAGETRSVTLQAQHQHVRLRGGPGFSLGAFDQQFLEIEYATAPHWTFAAVVELNNKYPEQRLLPGEEEGPFPAASISYVATSGHTITLWAGKRQAGRICTGGVCKFEPAFRGMELSGTFRF